MNPILLKPEGDARSQVIVMGRPLATMEAQEYYRHRTGFLNIVQQAFLLDETSQDGWLTADGWCAGCYCHGLFENDHFRHAVVQVLARRRLTQESIPVQASFNRQREYDSIQRDAKRSSKPPRPLADVSVGDEMALR